ncbi:MAG: hypothetical protein ABJH04_07515 [Cyclobacteriaceae bacterium]
MAENTDSMIRFMNELTSERVKAIVYDRVMLSNVIPTYVKVKGLKLAELATKLGMQKSTLKNKIAMPHRFTDDEVLKIYTIFLHT